MKYRQHYNWKFITMIIGNLLSLLEISKWKFRTYFLLKINYFASARPTELSRFRNSRKLHGSKHTVLTPNKISIWAVWNWTENDCAQSISAISRGSSTDFSVSIKADVGRADRCKGSDQKLHTNIISRVNHLSRYLELKHSKCSKCFLLDIFNEYSKFRLNCFNEIWFTVEAKNHVCVQTFDRLTAVYFSLMCSWFENHIFTLGNECDDIFK